MGAMTARSQLNRLQSDALLALSERLLQFEKRISAQDEKIAQGDGRIQAAEARVVAAEKHVAVLTRRIEVMETLLQQSVKEIEKLKEHVFPIDWDAFLAKRRTG